MSMPFVGHVNVDGRIAWFHPRALQKLLLGLAGRRVVAQLRAVSDVSADQLAYWWGIPVTRISKHTTLTREQVHALLLVSCFGFVVDKTTGREVPRVPAATELTQRQFTVLIDWVRPWALSTYGLEIPAPNDVTPADLAEVA